MSPNHTELADALRWSTQRSMAADTLWACGKRVEALRLARTALGHALGALRAIDSDAALRPSLDAVGLSERDARQVEAAADATQLELPEIESDLEEAHTRLFPLWRAASRSIERALCDRAEDPTRLGLLKRRAAVAMILGTLGFGLLVTWNWMFWPENVEIRATGYRVVDELETWPPENVFDRDEMTYWHLPPGETGSIELRFDTPRDFSALRILNAHDRHVDDNNRRDRRRYNHASREIVARAYAGTRLLAETEAELARVRDYERVAVPLEAQGVDRIVIEIVSFHGDGGGLAEIEIIE